MDPLISSAASGLRARMESLDMLANNLANAETTGYKTDRESYSLYAAPEAAADDLLPPKMPLIERPWTDYSQGVLRPTGNPLDFALSGKGFFVVNGPSGPLYTRNGSFRISSAGVLVSNEGYPVRVEGGGQLQLQSGWPLDVATDGTVRQAGQVLGKLDLVSFPGATAIAKQGNNYYRKADSAASAPPAIDVKVQQGSLENANVSAPESAVRLISVMRQFEMLQKAIGLGAEMNRKALEEVARVGS